MHENDADDGDATLDRRSLIRKVGVAGAIAWTAPVVLDSVLSPAAAQSGGGPGPGPSFTFTESFDGVPNGAGGLNYATFEPGPLPGTSFVVTGSNVDGVAVPQFGSGPFSPTDSNITVIELAGTSGGGFGGIAVTLLGLANLTYTLTFQYVARTARTFNVDITGFPTDPVTPASTGVLYTYTQVFTTSGNITITLSDTATDNQGVLIGNFSVVG